MGSEKQAVELAPLGDHQYVVRVHGAEEDAEAWVRVTPEVLDELGVGEVAESTVVHRTIAFLLERQDAADFPAIVELEDVLSYPDYRAALTGLPGSARARGDEP